MFKLCYALCWIWSCNSELIALTVVYRHGERTPFRLPNNYNTSFSAKPLAQLTSEGIKQHRQLGRYLRQRYKSLLPSGFESEKVRILSSDYDRTLMSALANAQGMFGSHIVAVHTVPREDDYILGRSSKCPAFWQWLNTIWKRPINVLKRDVFFNGPVAARLRQYIPDLKHRNFFGVADFLLLESERDPNHWIWRYRLRKAVEEHMTWMFLTEVCDQKVQRLRAGGLIDQIAGNIECMVDCMENNLAHNCSCKSVLLYSAHDFTLSYLLGAFGAPCNFSIPPFASAVLIELHKEEPISYKVNVQYLENCGGGGAAEGCSPRVSVICRNMTICEFQGLIRPVRNNREKDECFAAQNFRKQISEFACYGALALSMLLTVAALVALASERKRARHMTKDGLSR